MRLTPYERLQLLPYIEGCHKVSDVSAKNVKIVKETPPNFAAVIAKFPSAERYGVLFAYGDAIYNPSDITISPPLIAHECTHAAQQRRSSPEAWWEAYLASKDFRLSQELDAYRIEYRVYAENWNRAFRHRFLRNCAERLSGPLYNHMIKRKFAAKLILLEPEAGELDHVTDLVP